MKIIKFEWRMYRPKTSLYSGMKPYMLFYVCTIIEREGDK